MRDNFERMFNMARILVNMRANFLTFPLASNRHARTFA